MAEQIVNTEVVVKDYDTATGKSTPRKLLGELIVAVRVDDLPQGEADRLAAEGKAYPLTVDADGNLRVALPSGTKIETNELEVLREILAVQHEIRDLLMEIA